MLQMKIWCVHPVVKILHILSVTLKNDDFRHLTFQTAIYYLLDPGHNNKETLMITDDKISVSTQPWRKSNKRYINWKDFEKKKKGNFGQVVSDMKCN